MSKITDLIINSLRYYDGNYEKYVKLFKKFKYYSIVPAENDLSYNKIYFYDENKKNVFKSRYEIIGVYNVDAQVWTWAWGLSNMRKNMIFTIRKLLNYGLDLSPSEDDFFLKAELVTSRFKITNEIQLDIHAGIASYITKKPMTFKLIRRPSLVEKVPEEENMYPTVSNIEKNDTVYFLFLVDENGLVE